MSRALAAAFVGLFVGVGLLVLIAPTTSAGRIHQESVYFGVPRTPVAAGLDFEASCRVETTFEEVVVLDGGSKDSFIAAGPGPCAITIYVLGVPAALPLVNTTPLGYDYFPIFGLAGFAFGVADVGVDLVTNLTATYTGSSPVVSVSPSNMSWARWGSNLLSVIASSGAEGDSLSTAAPYKLTMGFSLGVTVRALGYQILSFDLAPIASATGTPEVSVPVSVDLRPTPADITGGWAPSPYAIQVNWTPNTDSDFGEYRIRVVDNTSDYVYRVDSKATASLTIPASPDRNYTVTATVVDRSGQTSRSTSVEIHTPPLPPPRPPPDSQPTPSAGWTVLALGLAGAALVGSVLVARPRRRKNDLN